MTEGILYFNHGVRCLARLLVSLHSLRRHYQGPVTIACEGVPPAWFCSAVAEMEAGIIQAPQSDEYGLLKKSRLWRISPYDVTLFLDADTLVRAPVTELFAGIRAKGLMVTWFNGWKTGRGKVRRRIEQWRGLEPEMTDAAIAYGAGLNTGIMGWMRGNAGMKEYEALTARGLAARTISRKTLDELAMQLVVTKHPHHLAGPEWNCGVVHGDGSTAKIVHYHGHKHCRDGENSDMWKAEFKALTSKPGNLSRQLLSDSLDQSINVWLQTPYGRRKDLTIVTAVNPKYAERAKANIAKWMQMEGLKDQRFIVFVNGFKNGGERKFLELPNVKVIRWRYDHPGATERETMLAAFVLGTAEHVETAHWMKLDADAAPLLDRFTFPEYQKFDVVSHKWGYTKCKGEEPVAGEEHWFNKMDRLFAKGHPVFSRKLDPVADFRVGHGKGNQDGIPMRFASFCHIERTDFTRKIARAVTAATGGRLPIPSHDTLTWYFTALWKARVKLENFKTWFNP